MIMTGRRSEAGRRSGPADGWARRWLLSLLAVLFMTAAGCTGPGGATSNDTAASESVETANVEVATGLGFLRDREIYMPQFARGADGSVYIAWTERSAGRGADVFISRLDPSNVFTPPVRVNDITGNVSGGDLDEGRPAIAIGDDGVIGVAWSARGEIRGAMSRDHGASFEPSLALNAADGELVYRGFVDIDVDAEGVAHAAWIDARFAPRGAEEPAELYYARIDGSEVTEINLTEGQVDSICACCRVDIDVQPDKEVIIAFRNTGGGYRDIHRMTGTMGSEFGEPIRLGPPMWELNGCPVIGPLNVGEATLWSEASTGKRRVLVATETDGKFEIVVEDSEEWRIDRPPRIVAENVGEALLLLPGRPTGLLLRGSGRSWGVVADDMPMWAMSGALIDGNLVLVGAINGQLQAERRAFDF